MPHNSSQWVTHTIDGGWATDYGTNYYATPQGSSLSIPWLKTCENIRFYPDGSFGKYPGLVSDIPLPIKAPKSSTGYIESTLVRNVYDYVRMGASLTGTRVRMAIVGSWLYRMSSGVGAIAVGDVGSSSTSPHHMTTFNDLLIIGGPTQAKSWDQTTFQALAGTPPVFSFSTSHAGRHWAGGVAALPSRLYYSAVGNPEDWVGAGSGSIDIDPGDGDAIVGLLSWKRELWVFKGPNRLSIHRITGTSPTDFARVPFIYGVSAAGPMSIFPVGDDFAFWSPRGSCHSLTTTSSYGDYTQAYLNYPILSWCRNPDNLTNGAQSISWQVATDPSQNISYCVLNNNPGSVDTPNSSPRPVILIMDWRFRSEANQYPRLVKLTLEPTISSVGLLADRYGSSQLIPVFGTSTGRILQEYPPDLTSLENAGAAFSYRVETPALTYGPTVYTKTIAGISVDIVSNYNPLNGEYGELDFSYGGRGAPAQTATFTNTDGVGLGVFVLGVDQLGGGNHIDNFTEATSGDSKAFTYTLVEDGARVASAGTDVRVKHFGILITPTGESLENS
jgi:hypothetical protein